MPRKEFALSSSHFTWIATNEIVMICDDYKCIQNIFRTESNEKVQNEEDRDEKNETSWNVF